MEIDSIKKQTTENDQLLKKKKKKVNWSFSEPFFLIPPTLNLIFFPVNQLIKKFWPNVAFYQGLYNLCKLKTIFRERIAIFICKL